MLNEGAGHAGQPLVGTLRGAVVHRGEQTPPERPLPAWGWHSLGPLLALKEMTQTVLVIEWSAFMSAGQG